ncbi:MAG: hypothetical protein JWO82_1542 [Akkermansiaceae bacterium]|nr:hypothetical protein [Akkermansiaceae bacterium]
MMRDESGELLRRYSEERSEAAFRELVRQHSGIVYGTALRKLGGDRAAAQDVMQEVFTQLVRKAPILGNVVLAGWLYRQTCRRAANHVRAESRRRKRELVAMEAMTSSQSTGPGESFSSPEIREEMDRALLALPGADRDALVLRYFESHDYKRVGASQGITEEAARKRVGRALEKLAAILRKNGVLTTGGAASLGSTMSGMAATTAVPEAVISRVAANALRAAPASGLAALAPLLKSFLAGLLMTSAAAGTMAASRSREAAIATTIHPPITTATVKREPLDPVYLKPVPGYLSAEQLIVEIKKLKAGPAHVLTQMRMALLLESISLDKAPEFFALAADRLSLDEKKASYTPLLDRWVKYDPDAAATCAFDNNLSRQIDPDGSSNLIVHIHYRWMGEDPSAAQKWLLREWSNENLKGQSSETTFRNSMALTTMNWLIGRDRQEEAFRFAAAIPDPASRLEVLAEVAGGSFSSPNNGITSDKAIRFYRALRGLPDAAHVRKIAHAFWKARTRYFPGELEKLKSTLTPLENFDLELIALELKASGSSAIKPSDGTSPLDRLIDPALQNGLAAGLLRREALQQIGESLVESGATGQSLALEFIDAHRDELELDDLLKEKIAEQDGMYVVFGGHESPLHGLAPLLWASRLSDPEQRLRLSRGTFRRMLLESPVKQVIEVPANPGLPEDLAEEFRTMLQDSP